MIVQTWDSVIENILTVQVKFKNAMSVAFIVNSKKKIEEMFFNASETII